LQYVEPVVAPLGESRDESWIFTQLGRTCGAPLLGWRFVQAVATLVVGGASGRTLRWRRFCARMGYRLMAWFYGRTLGEVRRHPHGLALRAASPGRFLKHGVLTDHGKVVLAPPVFVEAAAGLEAEFVAELEAQGAGDDRLRLVSRREKTSHNTWMHNVSRFVRHGGETRLRMHPDDAAARGLADGDACALRTDSGEIRVPVQLTDEMMPGTVSLPHGWGHQAASGLRVARETKGASFNVLTGDGPAVLERLSGMARLTGVAVSVTAVDDSAEASRAGVD